MNKFRIIFISLILFVLGCAHTEINKKSDFCLRTPQGEGLSCTDIILSAGPLSGPILKYSPPKISQSRSVSDLKTLVVMWQNFENLIKELKYNQNGSAYVVEKSDAEKQGLGRRFDAVEPDIIVGTEVGTIEDARDYSQKYLYDTYEPLLIKGNDLRGINIAFFIKKDLPFDFEYQLISSVGMKSKLNPLAPLFNRDLPVLIMRERGTNKAILAIAGTHEKSQRPDDDPTDKDGSLRRAEQAEATVQIITELQKKYPNLPIVLGGDFNNNVPTAPEFDSLRKYLKDAFDVAPNSVPPGNRTTHYYFKDNILEKSQLDGMFVNSAALGFIKKAAIQGDLDEKFNLRPDPKNFNERKERASDHNGIYLEIDFSHLYTIPK